MHNQYEGKDHAIQRKFFLLNLTEEIWSRKKNRRSSRFSSRSRRFNREMLFWPFRRSGRRRKKRMKKLSQLKKRKCSGMNGKNRLNLQSSKRDKLMTNKKILFRPSMLRMRKSNLRRKKSSDKRNKLTDS